MTTVPGPVPAPAGVCPHVCSVPDELAQRLNIPTDAVALCCREPHGKRGHVGFIGVARITWDTEPGG